MSDVRITQQILEGMERLGLVYRTGKVTDGSPEWALTALGRAVRLDKDGALPALERMEKLGVCRRTGGVPEWELTELGRTVNSSNPSPKPSRH